MKPRLLAAAVTTALAAAASGGAFAQTPAMPETPVYTPESALKFNEATRDHFTGKARFAIYPRVPGSADRQAIVHFDAGTINNWHSHSHGQYVIVTEGEGRYQIWGQPIQTMKKGDIVWFGPDVKHWHGAGEKTPVSHITIAPQTAQNKVTWLEKVELPAASATPETAPARALARQQGALSDKQLAIVPIAAFSATGDLARLKPAIAAGLDKGLTISEIREIFAHQYAYAGFPRALNGLSTLQAVLKERQARGLDDPQGNAPTALANPDYYQLGRQTLKTLGSSAADTVIAGFDGIDYALKAHLFGYLFSRDNLAPVNRQLVTVSTLSALGNVNAQLASHLKNTQNLGVSPDDLRRVFDVLEKEVSPAVAANAHAVLQGSGSPANAAAPGK